MTFFERHALALSTEPDSDWRAGDLVFWDTDGNGRADHLGILSIRLAADRRPLVLHHHRPDDEFPGRPGEDDVLFRWPVVAHIRWQHGP